MNQNTRAIIVHVEYTNFMILVENASGNFVRGNEKKTHKYKLFSVMYTLLRIK